MNCVLQKFVTWMFQCKLKSELLLIWIHDTHFHCSRSALWKCTGRTFKVWVIRTCKSEFLLQKFRFAGISLKFTTRIFTLKCKKSELRYSKQSKITAVLHCICYKDALLEFWDELQILEVLYRNLQVRFPWQKSELWIHFSNVRPMPIFA